MFHIVPPRVLLLCTYDRGIVPGSRRIERNYRGRTYYTLFVGTTYKGYYRTLRNVRDIPDKYAYRTTCKRGHDRC